jgi:hypothetical protein
VLPQPVSDAVRTATERRNAEETRDEGEDGRICIYFT